MRYHHFLSALFVLVAPRPLNDRGAHPVPRWDLMSVKHAWEVVPVGWETLVTLPTGITIDISISLNPSDESALIDVLHDVSNPRHPKYGAYLSQEQVAELVAPHPDALQLINLWLEHHGVAPSSISMSHGGSWLTLSRVPVSKANDLLGASYRYFLHTETNETVIRTLSYALPTVLHEYVQTIVPTTFFGSGSLQTPWRTPETVSGEPVEVLSNRDPDVDGNPSQVTVSFLRWLYDAIAYMPAAVDKNVLATVGFHGKAASQADLARFTAQYRPDGGDASYIAVVIGGGQYNSKNPSIQENLNVQYAVAISYPTPQIYFSVSGTGDPFVTWFKYILEKSEVPQTIDLIYGVAEQIVPLGYAVGVCRLFLQLAVRGASVLYASGDSGVGKGACTVTDRFGYSRVQFRPTFPASCPWVTAVGGTTGRDPEIGSDISGGGFSTIFARPPYQQSTVLYYLQYLGDQYKGLYSVGGRGIPDISAQAIGYATIIQGQVEHRQGTDCATATVAGIISLLNDYQLSNNQPPLGFLNTWLYGSGISGLNDITSGSNPGCNTPGFSAGVGWDPVTGLGTPDFEKLAALAPEQPG